MPNVCKLQKPQLCTEKPKKPFPFLHTSSKTGFIATPIRPVRFVFAASLFGLTIPLGSLHTHHCTLLRSLSQDFVYKKQCNCIRNCREIKLTKSPQDFCRQTRPQNAAMLAALHVLTTKYDVKKTRQDVKFIFRQFLISYTRSYHITCSVVQTSTRYVTEIM